MAWHGMAQRDGSRDGPRDGGVGMEEHARDGTCGACACLDGIADMERQ